MELVNAELLAKYYKTETQVCPFKSVMIILPPSEQKLFNKAHASAYSVANSTEIGVYFKVTKSVKCLITQLVCAKGGSNKNKN